MGKSTDQDSSHAKETVREVIRPCPSPCSYLTVRVQLGAAGRVVNFQTHVGPDFDAAGKWMVRRAMDYIAARLLDTGLARDVLADLPPAPMGNIERAILTEIQAAQDDELVRLLGVAGHE